MVVSIIKGKIKWFTVNLARKEDGEGEGIRGLVVTSHPLSELFTICIKNPSRLFIS